MEEENYLEARPMSLVYQIGDFQIDATELLTDDIAHIVVKFKDSERELDDLIEYIEDLPYSLKYDIIYYLAKDKKNFKYLHKKTKFGRLIDGFAKALVDVKKLIDAEDLLENDEIE